MALTEWLRQRINYTYDSIAKAFRVVDGSATVSAVNSTSTALLAGAIFTGTAIDVLGCGIVFVNVYSNVASATNGLSIQQSSDGTNWDHTDDYTVQAATGKNYSINPHSKYLRVVYTNGGTNQTAFRLQTICKANSKPSSHRIQDSIVDDDDAELVKSVLTGKANGTFKNVLVTTDGNLRISDNSSGLSIAKGEITGTSFIHKFGKAPDFDTSDNQVTVWDGANDALLSGNAMTYTYSTTANIDTISSSNNGDNQTLMAVYTIPNGYTGYMRDWYAATSGANKSSNYIIRLYARPLGKVFQLKHDSAISDNGTSAYQHKYEEPEVFSAGTDIDMRTQMTAVGGADGAVAAGFDIVLIQN